MTAPAPARARTRNAEASREALLTAGHRLFSERGYDHTTVRDIGEAAGVDPALIARYFGNKLNLYLATISADDAQTGGPADLTDAAAFVDWFTRRVDRRGPGPLLQALVRSDTAPEIRAAVRGTVTQRLTGPLTNLLAKQGVERPALHAEIAVAALVGVLLTRALGSFDELTALDRTELVTLLTRMIPELG